MNFGKNAFHLIKIWLRIDKPHTQTTPCERCLIKKYSLNKSSVVEIGVYEGYNTTLMAEAIVNEGIVYAIDPFFRGKFGISVGKIITRILLKRKKLIHKIHFIEKYSSEAADEIPENLDFVFIDGNHSFNEVANDFHLYSKKLSPNGVLAFHDARLFKNGWTSLTDGPVRCINEIILPTNEWYIIDEVDSLVIVKKKL